MAKELTQETHLKNILRDVAKNGFSDSADLDRTVGMISDLFKGKVAPVTVPEGKAEDIKAKKYS